jgi:hypothetical protein
MEPSEWTKKGAHTFGLEAESRIMSGYTGKKEGMRSDVINRQSNGAEIYQFHYSSVQFDVYYKSDSASSRGVSLQVNKIPK